MAKIEWLAYFAASSGYSEAARQYCIALKRLGTDLIPTSMNQEYLREYAWMAEDSKKKNDGHFKIVHDIPSCTSPGIYTTFEFKPAPSAWAQHLRNAQAVLTPSQSSKEYLGTVCDIEKIHVINHGVNDRFTPFGPSVELQFDGELPKFKFLSVFEWVDRKCGDRLIKAFQQAFTQDDDVGLFIKTRNVRNIPMLINKVPGCKIYVVDGFVNDMSQLYRAFDSYISCSSGEGWGETLSEAMACGLPTIGSNHSGNLEFMDYENSFLVDVEQWQPIGYNNLEPIVAPWMQHRPPKIDNMVDVMKLVSENSNEVKAIAKKGRRVSQDFTWEKAAKKIIEIVETIQA